MNLNSKVWQNRKTRKSVKLKEKVGGNTDGYL